MLVQTCLQEQVGPVCRDCFFGVYYANWASFDALHFPADILNIKEK